MPEQFDHKKIEKKWQKFWDDQNIYAAKDDDKKPKQYVLIEFPYPSGEGLHMGHLRPYLAGDIYSRFQRMNGHKTLFPIGWDAFGLPAENFAIKKGVHPSVSTAKNIANAKQQLKSWGIGFDWNREINTTDPEYYKWTQWIFLQFFKAGLAYEATGLINWCPKDKTGLANEEVIDGRCERCGTVVEKKEMKQWYLKITAYAEKLLEGLKDLNWSEAVKLQQANWIGKSEGAEIDFEIDFSRNKPRFVLLHGYKGSPNKDFFPWLKKEFEAKGHEVEVPEMPNTMSPNENEQVDFLLKNTKIDEHTVIIAHSLGCIVALKTLMKLNKPISGLLLVVPAMDPKYPGAQVKSYQKEFNWNFDFEQINKLTSGRIAILSDSHEEERVPYLKKLASQLKANLIEVTANNKHFNSDQEPLILKACTPDIKVFTTRPDTIYGATYLVLAPEHPWVAELTSLSENPDEVEAYLRKVKNKSEIERTDISKEKTGVELKNVVVINPATKEKIPVWIADYVLSSYGTGAIMAVPQHDERDREFAEKYNLPIVDKPLLSIEEATKKFGMKKTQYKLRDWVFSRQRYWGEPIPIIHCEECGLQPVPEDQLPVKLPEVEKYEPTGTGESPLAAIESWVNVKCPNCKGPAKRETNTMPQWAGSSWYWIRYTDPSNKQEFASKKLQKIWTPVDVYFGGMEHTTLHLLYSRFWNLFLHDQGFATAEEPFMRRIPHGIILGPDGEKMSKSRGNIINPDEIVGKFGADVLRMYEPFLGPHDATVPWSDKGILGVKRFLDKVEKFEPKAGMDNPNIHKLIKKISLDIKGFKFNTAIAAFMEFLNDNKELSLNNWKTFLVLLAPFAPHLTEELWSKLSNKDSIHAQAWPKFDEKLTKDEIVEVVVQINGKKKGVVSATAGLKENEIKQLIDNSEIAGKLELEKKQILKVIFVPDRLVNFVVKE